jgi:hypothetical protein
MTNRRRGFIKAIILIIIALVVLKVVFHIDFKDIVNSGIVQSVWSIIKTIFNMLWTAVLLVLDFLKAILNTAKNFLEGLGK